MVVTINVNGLSLCHKDSGGVVIATLPDVCKTPSPTGPVPIPYPNTAFSRDLANGTTTVTADGGHMIAVNGSDFSCSTGDEPGTLGGVKSGVNKSKATWISYSFDVTMEGKNACRLTDKMFLNQGNTVSLAGEMQPPLTVEQMIAELCEIACECKNAVAYQRCVANKIEEKYYDGPYPKKDNPFWREVSMKKGADGWDVIKNGAGDAPTSNPYTPGGGIRPDIVGTDGAGNPTRIIEMKFPGDKLNANQELGGNYSKAADDLGVEYDVLDVAADCAYCWDPPAPPPAPVPVPVPEPAKTTSSEWLPALGLGVFAIAVVACYASVACGAAVTAGGAAVGAEGLAAGAAVLLGAGATGAGGGAGTGGGGGGA